MRPIHLLPNDIRNIQRKQKAEPLPDPPEITAPALTRVNITRRVIFEYDLFQLINNTDGWEFQYAFSGRWAAQILDGANNRFYQTAQQSGTLQVGGDVNTLNISYRRAGSSGVYTSLGTIRFFISIAEPN